MNMKAIMFAGAGLFVSMSATAIWIGNDLAEIKAREQARKAAECAAAQPGAATSTDPALAGGNPQNGQVLDPNTGLPIASASTDQATAGGTTSNADCATSGGAASSDGQQAGTVDPVTGQVVDPNASSTGFDPETGQPITDPGAVADPSMSSDPGFSSADPAAATGVPSTDTSGF